jgi:outer membrane lipoprotein-sorting protein
MRPKDRYGARTQIAGAIHPTRVLCLAPLACLLTLPLTAQTLDEAFARIDKTSQQFKTVEADIKRNDHTAIVNEDAYDSGIIRVRREKQHDVKMLIDFKTPQPKTVALAGSSASIYNPKTNVVQEYNIGAKKDLVEQFLLLGFDASSEELKAAYNVTLAGSEAIGGQQTWHLVLMPKGSDVSRQLKSAELWISQKEGLPLQQKVLFSNGDFWLVTYSNLKFNPKLSDESLKLKPQKGAVIEHPQL